MVNFGWAVLRIWDGLTVRKCMIESQCAILGAIGGPHLISGLIISAQPGLGKVDAVLLEQIWRAAGCVVAYKQVLFLNCKLILKSTPGGRSHFW